MLRVFSVLFDRISIVPLVLFRIIFGTLVIVELYTYYFHYQYFDSYYIQSQFHFKYLFFEWVPNLNSTEFKSLLILTGISFFCVAIGFLYRFFSWLAFLCFFWIFFMESAAYLNHWYFILLLSFLIVWMPIHKHWSLDVYLNITTPSTNAPRWNLELLKAQTFIMLFFSGIVKLNSDWLSGNTITVFWEYFQTNNLVKLYHFIGGKNTNIIVAWGTVALELFLPILLYFKKTRIFAFVMLSLFLIQNAYLLQIGVFPYLSILCMALFYAKQMPYVKSIELSNTTKYTYIYVCSIYLIIQIALPLRIFFKDDFLGAGTNQTQFAWNMFLAMPTGHISYILCHQKNCIEIDPIDYGITLPQKKKLVSNSLSIYQFGTMLCKTNPNTRIYAKSFLSINKRPLKPFYKENIDICTCSK
jgi:hypothetical protein